LTLSGCLVLLAVSCSLPVWAQSSEESAVQYRNTVSGGISVGKVIGGDSPSTTQVGFDYLYRLNPKWEVGVQLDLVYERGFGDFEAYSVVPIVAYSINSRLPLFFGVGLEHERTTNDNEPLVRLGGEYSIYLTKDERLMLLPGGFVDWIDGDVSASVVLALGYTF
jgi:opacity protein-like surface antigen